MKRREHPLEEEFESSHKEAEEIPKQKHKTPAMPYTTEHQTVISRTTGLSHEISMGMPGRGMVPKNPFASKAQQGYMYAHPEILGKKALKEWSSKTDFKSLPKHVKKGK
jgi:hypothetical protein